MPFIIRLTITLLLMIITVSIGNFLINGINRIKTGIVVDKNQSPGYITPFTAGKNKPFTTPDIYMLAIQGQKWGKTVTYWKTVSKEEYYQYDINMQYP